MELLGESHLDVAEDNYQLVPLRDDLLILNGPHNLSVIRLGDSVLNSCQLDDTNKRNIIRYLSSSNKILQVGKDNSVKILSPTAQEIFVIGDILNDSTLRISLQESISLLEVLQDSDFNLGPDTEDMSQRVSFYLQQRIPELQMLPSKKQPWSECVLEGTYADLEPLFEDVASQPIGDHTTISKMLQRLKYNASHHPKHPSASPVVSAAVSPTEEIAVTGSADGMVAIWDISKGVRLVNSFTAPDSLISVLLGEELITIHHPNTLVVHQIGEHALSETLFQQSLEGTVVEGAVYVPATQKIVLALNVIGTPSKADYYLQQVSVELDDRSLEFGDRVRVEGSFAAIAATSSTNTVSLTHDGFVVLFDSSSSTITNSFKKPPSNYRFSDIVSSKGHIYVATLAGTILSFNLSNIPREALTSPTSDDDFGNFSSSGVNADDDFGSFAAPDATKDDDFGNFAAPEPVKDDDFGNFESGASANDDFGNFASPAENKADDFGFGDFAAAVPPTNVNGTPTQTSAPPSADLDEFGFDTSFSNSTTTSTSPAPSASAGFSPKFALDDRPGAGIIGSSATHNSSTGDFGELPRGGGQIADAGSAQTSPTIGASKLRKSRENFNYEEESPYTSPTLHRRDKHTAPSSLVDQHKETYRFEEESPYTSPSLPRKRETTAAPPSQSAVADLRKETFRFEEESPYTSPTLHKDAAVAPLPSFKRETFGFEEESPYTSPSLHPPTALPSQVADLKKETFRFEEESPYTSPTLHKDAAVTLPSFRRETFGLEEESPYTSPSLINRDTPAASLSHALGDRGRETFHFEEESPYTSPSLHLSDKPNAPSPLVDQHKKETFRYEEESPYTSPTLHRKAPTAPSSLVDQHKKETFRYEEESPYTSPTLHRKGPIAPSSLVDQHKETFRFEEESPYTSPSLPRKRDTFYLEEESPYTSPSLHLTPAVGQQSPQATPLAELKTSPLKSQPSAFDEDFGSFETQKASNVGSQDQFGDFGSQGQLGDFGATPAQAHGGLSSSPTQVQQDLGDFGNFSSTPSNSQADDDFGGFSAPPPQQNSELGDFSTTDTSSSPLETINLHGSSSSFSSTPTTPGLNFRTSSSTLPGSPSIFSQDAFADFEAPPPSQLSNSGAHPSLNKRASGGFDDFSGDFGTTAQISPAPQRLRTPSPQRTSPAKSPQLVHTPSSSQGLGDFGEQASTGDFDFGFSGSATPPKADDFGGNSAPAQIGDFGEFEAPAPSQPAPFSGDFDAKPITAPEDDFGDFGEKPPTTQSEDFGNFGEKQAVSQADDFGDFGEKPASGSGEDFGEFGEKQAADDDFGDFGERPAASSAESFGDFGESPAAGDFGETSAVNPTSAAPSDDFGDFGDFAQPSGGEQKGTSEEDDFGDFGDFSKSQGNADDDFGDFGDFSAADQADFGDFEAPTETAPAVSAPAPAPTPAPQPVVPSIFSQDEKQLSETLATTFSTAFSSLIPPTSQPKAALPENLNLEASLKGYDKSPSSIRNSKCSHCGVILISADASSCLACGTTVGAAPASTWSGVVLPPIAEIKFWDALGVPIKQMTEKAKEPTALSSSQGILTPVASTLSTSVPSTPATSATLSSSWDFSNPFPSNRVSATPSTTPAAVPVTSSSSSALPSSQTGSHQRPAPSSGLSGQHSNILVPSSQAPSSSSSRPPSSSFPPPSSTGTGTGPGAGTATAPRNNADDDFFLSFESTPAPTPAKSPSLLPTSTPSSTQPWTQFINRIPDLSFAVADKLVIPSH